MKKPSEVERAAIRWWRGNRPVDWSLDQHLKQPLVNCTTSREDSLARAVARALRGGR